MSSVETINGPVEVSRLGRTLMHEHVFIVNPELLENYYADWWDEDERVRDAAAKLTGLKQRGIDTIVDPTVLGLGRNIPRIQRVAELVDITITVHTDAYTQTGRLVVELFRQEGVNLEKVVLGHCGDSNDLDYLREMADTGAFLGMDRFGLEDFNPTPQRIATIAALCGQGYTDRMVLSHDANCLIDYFPGELQQLVAQTMPNWNYLHISDHVLPALRAHGVEDKHIDQMLVDNPRRYFEPT